MVSNDHKLVKLMRIQEAGKRKHEIGDREEVFEKEHIGIREETKSIPR